MEEQMKTSIYHMGKCIGSLVLDKDFICEIFIDGWNNPSMENITIHIQERRFYDKQNESVRQID